MLVESDGVVALFDCPESSGTFTLPGDNGLPGFSWLPDAIGALTTLGRVTDIFYSHSHYDHIGSCALVAEAFEVENVWGSPYLTTIFEDRNARFETDPTDVFGNARRLPSPTRTFKDGDVAQFGKVSAELRILDGHNIEDALVFINYDFPIGIDRSIAFTVDLLFPKWSFFNDLARTQSIVGFGDSLAVLQSYGADVIISGHFGVLGSSSDVDIQLAYYEDMKEGAALGLATVNFGELIGSIAATNPALLSNTILVFGEWLALIDDVCFDYVTDVTNRRYDYVSLLGGVEVNLRGHCHALQYANRIGEDFQMVDVADIPTDVPTDLPVTSTDDDDDASVGEIAAIVLGTVAVAGVAVLAAIHVRGARAAQKKNNEFLRKPTVTSSSENRAQKLENSFYWLKITYSSFPFRFL